MAFDKGKTCTYRSFSSSESSNLLFGLGKLLFGSKRLQNLVYVRYHVLHVTRTLLPGRTNLEDKIPELFMVLVQKNNQTRAL
jgi:hypothetical protein